MPSVVSHSSVASNSALSKRRRFQPPITSFFNPTPSETQSAETSSVSHNHYSAATFSATPVVPAKVQSSLLSVGMRVRKSIADGYKTQLAVKSEMVVPVGENPVPRTYSRGNSCPELSPFSGISKSSFDPYDHSSQVITDDGDAYSIPPSSQDSVMTTTSVGQKRTLESDIFVDEDSWNDAREDELPQVRSVGRHILSPSLGQQRRRMLAVQGTDVQSSMALDDFEEASFLRRREEVDADYIHMDCA